MGAEPKGLIRATFAHRDLCFLLAGQAVSQTGDWLHGVSLLAFVYAETRSSAWVAAAASRG
jgi:hypothetical protein